VQDFLILWQIRVDPWKGNDGEIHTYMHAYIVHTYIHADIYPYTHAYIHVPSRSHAGLLTRILTLRTSQRKIRTPWLLVRKRVAQSAKLVPI
jgi:hypothetical protein